MRYVVLNEKKQVIDILTMPGTALYPNARCIAVSDEEKTIAAGMVYDDETDSFSECAVPEPTQADRIEANLDYLVLLNS